MTDTLYADVSEHQHRAVDDSYPFRVIAIRSNDGGHADRKWDANHRWCRKRCDEGALAFFIVYFVWRPNWQVGVDLHKRLVGTPHPRMVVMLDVESWSGEITGDQSAGINAAHAELSRWLGSSQRVIGYGNPSDLNRLWPRKPPGIRLVVAAYGSNPGYPGKVAHQYTDGQGFGARAGLPDGCPPFHDPADSTSRHCMNAADGLSPEQFAAACGIAVGATPIDTTQRGTGVFTDSDRELLRRVRGQLDAERTERLVSRSPFRTLGEGPEHTLFDFELNKDAAIHILLMERMARYGDPDALKRLRDVATADPGTFPERIGHIQLAKLILDGVSTTGTVDGPVPRPDGVHTLYTVGATWAKPEDGIVADLANTVDPTLYTWQPVDVSALIAAANSPTYEDVVKIGAEELVRLIAGKPGTFALSGHSQGAEAISRVFVELQSGVLKRRRKDFIGAAAFGNPRRELGRLFPGDADPGGRGIAAERLAGTPDEWAEYANPGDLYAVTSDDAAGAVLTSLYEAAMKLPLANPAQFANPLQAASEGEGSIVEQLRKLLPAGGDIEVQFAAIGSAVEFLLTNPPTLPHVTYNETEALPNTQITSVDHAVSWLNQLGRAATPNVQPVVVGGGVQ